MFDYEKFLKKQESAGKIDARNSWSIDNIEAGFEKFYDYFGFYPSASDIDKFEYLPTARTIQRTHGGLLSLRNRMNLRFDVSNHNSGAHRSDTARLAMQRSADYEEKYCSYLIERIPEVYVHEHKVVRFKGYKTDVDFCIYLPYQDRKILIDLFYAMDIVNLLKQVRIKEPKYSPIRLPTYFLSVNPDIPQDQIEKRVSFRKTSLAGHIEVYNLDYFNAHILPNILNEFKQTPN